MLVAVRIAFRHCKVQHDLFGCLNAYPKSPLDHGSPRGVSIRVVPMKGPAFPTEDTIRGVLHLPHQVISGSLGIPKSLCWLRRTPLLQSPPTLSIPNLYSNVGQRFLMTLNDSSNLQLDTYCVTTDRPDKDAHTM